MLKVEATRKHLIFFEEPELFFIKHGTGMWKLEVEPVEGVKFLWKRKHFEERNWKWKQTRKRLTLYKAGSGSKKYFTAFTFMV